MLIIAGFDLDRCLIITQSKADRKALHPAHELSEPMEVGFEGRKQRFYVHLINPVEQVKLFNSICEDPNIRIMFVTANRWKGPDIINLFCTQLKKYGLSEKAERALRIAYFHSPVTDAKANYFPNTPIETIERFTKDIRLKAIFEKNKELEGCKGVYVDDKDINFYACKKLLPNFIPVLAKTLKAWGGSKRFYEQIRRIIGRFQYEQDVSAYNARFFNNTEQKTSSEEPERAEEMTSFHIF